MKLKSYFSGTVEAALELARREMGEDALLIHARAATTETRAFGAFEVVFGIPPAPLDSLDSLPQAWRNPAFADSLREELFQERLSPEPAPKSYGGFDPTLGLPGAPRRIIALVGPPGSGKTATLLKLATRYGLAFRRGVHILSAGVYRAAGPVPLQALASLLGMRCTPAASAAALFRAVEDQSPEDLLFIDTPGLAPAEMNANADLAHCISSHPEMDVHLVLSASTDSACLHAAIKRYQVFHPAKLLFTRLDEASGFSAPRAASARFGLPISFLGTGQRVPDDIEPATQAALAALLGGDPLRQLRSAGAAA